MLTPPPQYAVPQLNPLHCPVHSCHSAIHHTLTRLDMTVHLAIRWYYMLLVAFLESFPLLQEVSGIPAALILEASLVTTLLGAAALCYNIYSFSGDLKHMPFTAIMHITSRAVIQVTLTVFILSFNFSISQELKFLKCKLKIYLIFVT